MDRRIATQLLMLSPRHCYRLVYRSQREQAHDREASAADKLRAKLQWEPGILNGNGDKPKGMHWATFERLHAQHEALVNRSIAGLMAKFGMFVKDVGE